MIDVLDTVTASDFKAKCLDLLDRVGAKEISVLNVTKRGKVVATISAPPATSADAAGLHGFLRGSVIIPIGADLTAPALTEPLDAELGTHPDEEAATAHR